MTNESTKPRGILYLGQDIEYFKRLQSFSIGKEIKINELFFEQYTSGALINQCVSFFPSIVFVDFKHLETCADSFFSELIFLKKIDTFKGILFVGLFANKMELENYSYAFTSGLQLSFVKGCEEHILFSNSFYIGYGEESLHDQYVKAKDIDLEMKLGFCSTLTAISNDSLIIETDLPTSDSLLSLVLPLLPELNIGNFTIRQRKATNYAYPMLETFVLDIPMAGPWDTNSNDKIKKETIEEWLGLYANKFENTKYRVQVITRKTDLAAPLFISAKSRGISFEQQETLNVNSVFEELSLKRPHLIFLDLEDNIEGTNNLECFFNITNAIHVIENYKPIIIITNTNSKSEAIQNIYNYKSIIAIPMALTNDFFKSFISRLVEKNTNQSELTLNFFSTTDRGRSIDVNHNVIISSLSELEISFYSQLEIPLFTVLHLTVPLDCYATVIPLLTGQQKESRGWSYTAQIHGLSEDELTILRKFVNQIIYKPLQQFTVDEVRLILSQKEPPKTSQKAFPVQDDREPVGTAKAEHFEKLHRIKIKGRSKL